MRNPRYFLVAAGFLCVAGLLTSCGGGGGTDSVPPTVTSVTATCASTTLVIGKTSQCTATAQGMGNFNPAVTWNSSKTAVATVDTTGLVTAVSAGTADITATSVQTPGVKSPSVTITVVTPLAITVSESGTTVNAGATITLSTAVTGGTGSASVAWSAPAGTFNPATGLSTTYTAPSAVPSPAIVTITATATDPTGSATATASVTVQRVITIALSSTVNLPNNEIYADFGADPTLTLTCTGCLPTDTFNVLSTYGAVVTTPLSQLSNPWSGILFLDGIHFIPGPIKMWITGADSVTSNTLRFTFDGGSMVGFQDPSTGESYYYYGGDGGTALATIFALKPDGTADTTYIHIEGESPAFTLDPATGYAFLTDGNGIGVFVLSNTAIAYGIPLGEVAGLDTNSGLVCAVQPQADKAYCFMATQAAIPQSNRVIATIGFPQGSQPAAVKVLDASHVVVFTRGDSKLSWFTISGATATPAGTLALSGFTNADAAFRQTYPWTGGGNIVVVGSVLGVMGRVANGNGTVSEKLALVNNAAQTINQYVNLPDGTIFLAADPTNGAVVAEHPDYSGATPVTAFTRIYADTGNSVLLHSTSNLLPGAGFLVTRDGSHILISVQGTTDRQLNQ